MEYFSIFEPSSKVSLNSLKDKLSRDDLKDNLERNYTYPQEDYLIAEPPVFVVSDGVTLDFKRLSEKNKKYPNPSPAGEVAKIFCQAVVKKAQELYGDFGIESVSEVFKVGNRQVGEFNKKIEKSDISGNPTGFYSATGAFVVVKENKAYWASICDSFVAHFDKNMNLKFMSSGSCTPYAVINGEEKMASHLETGVFDIEPGDRVLVLTDGFEHYVTNSDFLEMFKNWDRNLKTRIAEFSKNVIPKDPQKFGHERSLIAVSF